MTRILCNAVLAALIAAVFVVFALARVYPFLNDYQTVHIQGRSMEPAIPLSALAYVQSPADSYAIGDVVTYAIGSQLVTHRISGDWSGIGNGPWQLTGDANDAPDGQLVTNGAIIGKAVAYVPFAGLLVSSLTQPPVIAFLLILAALLLYLPDTRREGT